MTRADIEREPPCDRLACGWSASENTVLSTLLENVSDLIIVATPDGRIRRVSRPMPESANGGLVGDYVSDQIGKEHRRNYGDVYREAIEAGDVRTIEVKSSSDRWWWCRIVPRLEDGVLAETMIICTDITKQKEAEDAAHECAQSLEKTCESHERLRQLVFCEIHEEIAQVITGALLHLQVFARRHTDNREESAEILDTVVRLLRGTVIRSQEIANLLRPPVLDEIHVLGATDGEIDA